MSRSSRRPTSSASAPRSSRGLSVLVQLCVVGVVTGLLAGCALEPDRAGDGPLYFRCADDGQCVDGFRCVPQVALLDGEATGLCLASAPLGETTLDAAEGCGDFLEARRAGLATSGAGTACLLPFQCPAEAAGDVLPADHTGCPLGFVCIASEDGSEACVACGFASCDTAVYGAASATLAGLDPGTVLGCLERGVPDASPFADVEAGRVYCRLEPSADGRFAACPGGWQPGALPEKCGPGDETFCYIVTGVGGIWPDDSTAVRAGSDARTDPVAPLMLTPAGSARSCRPSP